MRLFKYVNEQNDTVSIQIKKPSECTKEEKKTFISLVISGNQNAQEHVRKTFPKLVWVGLLYEGTEIKAVSSIKKGLSGVFERAGVSEIAKDYPYEVGFSFTSTDSRGKGYNVKLEKKLFSKISGGIFCTIRVNNEASLAVHKKLGFKPVGKPYKGIVTDVLLLVLK